MGEREITEQHEVEEEEKVHFCDFCGRSSEEFDGTFNDVYTNPRLNLGKRRNRKLDFGKGTGVFTGTFVSASVIELHYDEGHHFCDECHVAHIEVHNDNS